MTLEQLRIFVAVAEREHVTQAARDIHLTPSATSAAIAALEARHATRLFDRVGRGIVLTEAGRLFLPEARAVLARACAAEKVLADLAGLVHGSLALAGSQTVANYWLPPLIERYRGRYPGVSVSLAIGNTDFVASRVQEGSADLGFIEGDIDAPVLAATPIAADEMVLVAPVTHRWHWRPPAGPAELAEGPWVLREPGSGTRAIFESYLQGAGVAPAALRTVLEYPSNEAVRAAVEAGSGVTVISRRVVEGALRAGTMSLIDYPLPSRQFLSLRHRERYSTKAAQAFLDLAGAS
ncbi:LysR family transcriptional regulator [Ancylobacter dichloromethanicus]|uniref:LysR family transcriptional regulator n=1 Tax=Ancylobacter dichloromethanicus TaxID=518825 RepID=A0A9W6JCZ4_9HYPH|nr:LysR family transcriptional regulator [Ancylobacter dichloromethanicus]MBS7554934.1 LysR family transcriptional regulator [Ancylobacter dichloromethanicus]GLK73328.1 LysR family transcriptional regulator [Ancylobacter dichloromethanicus]